MSQTCWGDFRFNLGLPGPRGGRRWTRLVPQFGVLQLSSRSGLWEAISWPLFVLEKCMHQITKTIWKTMENPIISQTCLGDFWFNLGLPGPRGGRRWTRLVPQFDFLQLSSKSGLWEAISWPFFVFGETFGPQTPPSATPPPPLPAPTPTRLQNSDY